MKTYQAGIDVGSTTVKLVVLDENGKMLFGQYQRHLSHTQRALSDLLRQAREALGEGGFADPGGAVQCDDRQTLHDYSSSRIALISIVFSSAVPTETRRFRGRP